MKAERVGRERRADESGRIQQRPDDHDASRAVLVGQRTDERLDEAEKQVLERHREPEVGPADADLDALRRWVERLDHAEE